MVRRKEVLVSGLFFSVGLLAVLALLFWTGLDDVWIRVLKSVVGGSFAFSAMSLPEERRQIFSWRSQITALVVGLVALLLLSLPWFSWIPRWLLETIYFGGIITSLPSFEKPE